MEKPRFRTIPVVCSAVILLGVAAFACCVAAEFKKSKAKDMEIDGSLCHLPRSPAFGLGIAALVCLSVAQVAGTTVAATSLCAGHKSKRSRILPISLLILSWISFGLAAILLGTGSSMNDKQPYGRGWLNAECYVVKDGVYVGSAILAAATVIFVLGFAFSTTTERMQHRTGPGDEERNQGHDRQQKQQADSGGR